MDLETGDVVLCTVDRIVGTTVFVHIAGVGNDLEGSIVFSEIAPGRIRNIRDYVVPHKKIVCKILRISGDRIDLSLRRVTQKEQKEIKERYKQERSLESMLEKILPGKSEEIIKEILKKESIYSFFEKAKKNPEELEKLIGKQNSEKILEILKTEKQKKAVIKREISLKSTEAEGLATIKEILGKIEGVDIRYVSAGKYSLKKEAGDIKDADQKLREIMETIEKKAKKNNLDFSILKK